MTRLLLLLGLALALAGAQVNPVFGTTCDRHRLCLSLVESQSIAALACSTSPGCRAPDPIDCLRTQDHALRKWSCTPLHCTEVLSFARSAEECSEWYPEELPADVRRVVWAARQRVQAIVANDKKTASWEGVTEAVFNARKAAMKATK